MPGLNGSSNGHSMNGQPPAGGNGGGSSQVLADLGDRRHKRETYMMLSRAVQTGLAMPADTLKAAVSTAIKDMSEAAPSTRARAREFLLSVQKHSVDAAIALDKIERLDEGKPTERHDVSVQQREAVRRVLCDPEAHRAASALARRIADQMETEDE